MYRSRQFKTEPPYLLPRDLGYLTFGRSFSAVLLTLGLSCFATVLLALGLSCFATVLLALGLRSFTAVLLALGLRRLATVLLRSLTFRCLPPMLSGLKPMDIPASAIIMLTSCTNPFTLKRGPVWSFLFMSSPFFFESS